MHDVCFADEEFFLANTLLGRTQVSLVLICPSTFQFTIRLSRSPINSIVILECNAVCFAAEEFFLSNTLLGRTQVSLDATFVLFSSNFVVILGLSLPMMSDCSLVSEKGLSCHPKFQVIHQTYQIDRLPEPILLTLHLDPLPPDLQRHPSSLDSCYLYRSLC